MQIHSILIIITIILNQATSLLGQFCPKEPDFDCVTGIKITKKEFNQLFEAVLAKEATNEERTVKEYIDLFRVMNTLHWNETLESDSEYYNQIRSIKDESIVDGMFKLNADYSRGGAMWSNTHKILIGGWKHYNSYYKITN